MGNEVGQSLLAETLVSASRMKSIALSAVGRKRARTDPDGIEIGTGAGCITGKRLDAISLFDGNFFDLVGHDEILSRDIYKLWSMRSMRSETKLVNKK